MLAWLKEQPQLKRLPVLFLTSSRMKEDINRAYDLGVNSYLVKPVKLDDLTVLNKMVVEYWVGHKREP